MMMMGQLLVVLAVLVVCLLVGIVGALTFYVFMQAGLSWLGMLIAVAMAVGVGTVMGNLG